MPLQDRQQLQQLLDSMRRATTPAARLDACRRLFSQLNYQATRTPLAVDLPQEVAKQLAGALTIIATAGKDDAFLVVHVQLAEDRLARITERAIVQATLRNHPYALFVFSNADHSQWHLLNVKIARRETSDDNRDAKLRRLFRRISIGADDRLRTAVERIEKLDLTAISPDLFEISPLAIQQAHDDAFDVEAVTREFFKEYKRVFEAVEEAIKGLRGAEKRRLFTQRLFNRLMFIVFIQRKGWLKFDGMEENEYLEALWKDYQSKKKSDSNLDFPTNGGRDE